MPPDIPTRESQLTLAAREQIDWLCERFEKQWRSGERPEIQTWLEDAPAEARPALLKELVALDLEYRRRAGESPSVEEYARRFSDLAAGSDFLSGESLVGTQTRTATFRPEPENAARLELPPPKTVGRYEIRDLLGRGAFGAVYLGWDPQLKRLVAIKVPRLADENTEAQIEAFLEEARRAVQLERHAGIVPVYDVGRDGDICYIVSQYIEGGTLSQRIKQGLPPLADTVQMLATLADVVHFAHRQGWVHRDIKPSNILLDREGRPYLADFGLTSRLDEMRSADGPPHGTPNYMAPELARDALAQMRRKKPSESLRPDQRSDVYSLGVVLYQLLTGRLPFEAEDLESLFDKVLHSDAVPPRLSNASIPVRLEEVCLKALAKEPSNRYRTAADLRDDLKLVAMGLRDSSTAIKVDERSLWGLPQARLAAVVGTWLLLTALAAGIYFAASYAFRKPTEHTSPGGDTNVALLAPKQVAADTMDRKKLLDELRVLLREEGQLTDEQAARSGARRLVRSSKSGDKLPGGPVSSDVLRPGPLPPEPVALVESTSADGLFPERFKKLEQQVQAARAQQNTEQEFFFLMQATNELVDGGHAKEAEQAARRMTELASDDEAKRPIAFGQLGLAQSKLGRYEEALASQQRALVGYREVYEALRKSENPRAQKDLSHMSRMLGLTLNRVANAQKELKKHYEAEKSYREAQEVLAPFADRKSELTTVLMNYGALHSVRHRHVEAIETLTQALALAEELGDQTTRAEVLVNLGNAQSRSGDELAAIGSYAQADKLLPADVSYTVRSRLLYNWISSLIAEGRFDEARVQLQRLREIARPDDPLAQRILKLAEPLLK